MSVIHYGIAKKILDWTRGVYGDPEETKIKSVAANFTADDIMSHGLEASFVLCPLPEGAVLMNAAVDISTPFSDTSLGAKLSIGIESDESDLDTDELYSYKGLVFDQQDLGVTGSYEPQGYLTDIGNKTLNKNINNLVAYFNVMGVWSSTDDLSTASYANRGAGTITAALCFGGTSDPPALNVTEEYDGSSWTSGGNLNLAVYGHGGCGTQTAALKFGGADPTRRAQTETYNGAAWTNESGNTNVAIYHIYGCGTQTAGLSMGGNTAGDSFVVETEEWDGVVWTFTNDLNTAYREGSCFGIQNAAVAVCGITASGNSNLVEEYNGSTWSTASESSLTREQVGAFGLNYAGVIFGGSTGTYQTFTEVYNGIVWTASNDMNEAKNYVSGSANSSISGLCHGGRDTGGNPTNNCEEYNPGSLQTLTSAWFTGGDLNTTDYQTSGCGNQNAAIKMGGRAGSYNNSEEYDGQSWTVISNLPVGRYFTASFGTQTAAVIVGGDEGGSTNSVWTHEWNGSSWASSGNLNTARRHLSGSGASQNAGLSIGGYTSSQVNTTEEYNGSNWNAGGNLNSTRRLNSSCGTQDDTITTGSNDVQATTETYNGTVWAVGTDMNLGRHMHGCAGDSSTNAVVYGGTIPPNISSGSTEELDGTTWSNGTDMPTNLNQFGSAGTQSNALSMTGSDGSSTAYTFEYNKPSQGDLDLNITFSYI